MSSTTKRVLTDKTYESMLAPQPRNDAIPPELALRLQNIGSRVRKNVTEGYATNRCLSAPSSPPAGPPRDHTLFRSANDTLRDVFSSMPPGKSSPASPKKRTWSALDQVSQDDFAVGDDGDAEMQTADIGEAVWERPVKPLRRLKRPFKETRSLPVGLLRFSGEVSNRTPSVDDDWSLSDTTADQL